MSISVYVKLKPGYTMADVLGVGPASVKLAAAWREAKQVAWTKYCAEMNSGKPFEPTETCMAQWSLNSPATFDVELSDEQSTLLAGYTIADRIGAAKLLVGGMTSSDCARVGGRALAGKYGEKDENGYLESGKIPDGCIPEICDELGWFGIATGAISEFYYG